MNFKSFKPGDLVIESYCPDLVSLVLGEKVTTDGTGLRRVVLLGWKRQSDGTYVSAHILCWPSQVLRLVRRRSSETR